MIIHANLKITKALPEATARLLENDHIYLNFVGMARGKKKMNVISANNEYDEHDEKTLKIANQLPMSKCEKERESERDKEKVKRKTNINRNYLKRSDNRLFAINEKRVNALLQCT